MEEEQIVEALDVDTWSEYIGQGSMTGFICPWCQGSITAPKQNTPLPVHCTACGKEVLCHVTDFQGQRMYQCWRIGEQHKKGAKKHPKK